MHQLHGQFSEEGEEEGKEEEKTWGGGGGGRKEKVRKIKLSILLPHFSYEFVILFEITHFWHVEQASLQLSTFLIKDFKLWTSNFRVQCLVALSHM